MSHTIAAENIGPLEKFSFCLKEPGLTVLSAANGAGKSVLLDAVQKLAQGGGRLPLRDGAKRGFIEGFGARLSIAAKSQHTGEFNVTNLEGKFDLAELVDPGLEDPLAADRRRIRALVGLTGIKADLTLFKDSGLFDDFDTVVTATAASKHDLVDMAEQVKRDYEAAARKCEDQAQKESGAGKALEAAICEVDPAAETDEGVLRMRYDTARDAVTRLKERSDAADTALKSRELTFQALKDAKANYTGPTVETAKSELLRCEQVRERFKAGMAELEALLMEANQGLSDASHELQLAAQRLEAAEQHTAYVAKAEQALQVVVQSPTDDDIDQASKAMAKAGRDQEYGTLARGWASKRVLASKHLEAAMLAEDRAKALRGAAGAIDEVLSSAIKSPVLRVESLDGKARLVVDNERRGTMPYHDLSAGERWKIAIELGATQAELLVIPQEAFEGLDAFVIPVIHETAKRLGCYILTAQATRDTTDGAGMQAKTFEPEAAAT